MEEVVLGIHGSHNSSFALFVGDELVEMIELERFLSKKNAAFFHYFPEDNVEFLIKECLLYIEKKFGIRFFNKVRSNSFDLDEFNYLFNTEDFKHITHHKCHAYSSLYQSNHEEALIFSFDGGSDEGFFNVFKASKVAGLTHLGENDFDLCVPYAVCGHYCTEIGREDIFWGNLVYPGKIMGLSAYGTINPDLFDKLELCYRECTIDDVQAADERFKRHTGITEPIEGADLAATNQAVFEKLFLQIYLKYKGVEPNLPVHFVGGGALNILNNSKILKHEPNLFITPNSNDTSIALGAALSEVKPAKVIDVTYKGADVYDEYSKSYYISNYELYGIDEVVDDIADGKVVGVVNGRSEHGPRALGNRSIICSPRSGMKDILNQKVKGREYYRPFAPIVKLEHVNRYFHFNRESRWMSFAAKVRDQYKESLASITHKDGTARIQTITEEQNSYIYSILTRLELRGEVPVIVNTSFNLAGKPILNTYKEAFEVLDNSEMDGLVIDFVYIRKGERLIGS